MITQPRKLVKPAGHYLSPLSPPLLPKDDQQDSLEKEQEEDTEELSLESQISLGLRTKMPAR